MTITKRHKTDYTILISKVLLGDRRSCNMLYGILILIAKDAVRKKAYGVGGLDFDIMVHDIIVKIFENLPKFNQRENLRNWSYRVAINFIIDLHRRKQSQVNLVLIDPEGGYSTLEEIPTGNEEITDENIIQITELLQEISLVKRQHFCWYFTDEKTIRNLSLESGKSIGAINSSIFRTKTLLKKIAEKRGIRF